MRPAGHGRPWAIRNEMRDANWAYMVMTALAWNLKAWFGLLLPNRSRGMNWSRWSSAASCRR